MYYNNIKLNEFNPWGFSYLQQHWLQKGSE